MNVDGKKSPKFSSSWEKAVAYHHGLYVPETYSATKTADDIRLAVANFSEKVHKDSPKDACKYLAIEEFRCLNVYQYETQPEVAVGSGQVQQRNDVHRGPTDAPPSSVHLLP